jgi:hypothetical protein
MAIRACWFPWFRSSVSPRAEFYVPSAKTLHSTAASFSHQVVEIYERLIATNDLTHLEVNSMIRVKIVVYMYIVLPSSRPELAARRGNLVLYNYYVVWEKNTKPPLKLFTLTIHLYIDPYIYQNWKLVSWNGLKWQQKLAQLQLPSSNRLQIAIHDKMKAASFLGASIAPL